MATPITLSDSTSAGTTVVENTNANARRRCWPYVVSAATTYTVLTDDSYLILCDATAGAFDVDLPAAASSTNVRVTVKKIDASANAVTVDGNGAETIDGAATYSLAAQWDSVTITCNGTAWYVEATV